MKGADPKREPTPFLGDPVPPRRQAASVTVLSGSEPRVVVLTGSQRGAVHLAGAMALSIGRDSECTISLDDESASRRHAEVLMDDGAFVLRDLGSTNGTFLRGVLRDASRPLAHGDRFRIADTELMFCDPQELLLDEVDRANDAASVDRRQAARITSVVFYSSGRIEGRGLLYDLSASGARIVDGSTAVALGAAVQLVLPDFPSLAGVPIRGRVARLLGSGFAVEFAQIDERLTALFS